MMMTTRRSLVHRISVVLAGLLVVATVLPMSGCSSLYGIRRQTKMVYKGVEGSAGTYRKTMAVLPFENNVPWSAVDLAGSFSQKLQREIKTGGKGVLLLIPGSPEMPDLFNESPRLTGGGLDIATLTSAGRASGINLILSARLVDLQHVTEDRGLFWFARVAHQARIQMGFSVYHTGTGAKLEDQTFFQTIEISEAEGELIDADKMPEGLSLKKPLIEIAEKMAKTTNTVLKHIPWEGYVKSVQGDAIILSSGAACGLKKGRELTVYNVEKLTVEDGAQTFFSPGTEAGTITITAVYPDRSEAALKYGGPVLPGSMVRAK